jgi:hypothetical protein
LPQARLESTSIGPWSAEGGTFEAARIADEIAAAEKD